MRIAFVVSNLTYPPREGLHQQTLLSIQRSMAQGHKVDLFGFCKNLSRLNRSALDSDLGIRFEQDPIQSGLPGVLLGMKLHFLPVSLQNKSVRRLYESILGCRYDVVHFESIGACGLVRTAIARKSVLGLIDPGSLRFRRFAAASASSTRVKMKVGAFVHSFLERRLAANGSTVHLVSFADARFLQERLKTAEIAAIPVSVPRSLMSFQSKPRPHTEGLNGIVFLDLRYGHLRDSFRWFIEYVFRPFIQHGQRISLSVLGRVRPDHDLLQLTCGLPISFLGWVENHLEVLANADVIITPDRVGTGLKNRVLESMALGRPVIGTDVAFEGIPATNGKDAWIARTKADMIAALTWVDTHAIEREEMGRRAQRFVIETFGEARIGEAWEALYCKVAMRGAMVG